VLRIGASTVIGSTTVAALSPVPARLLKPRTITFASTCCSDTSGKVILAKSNSMISVSSRWGVSKETFGMPIREAGLV
jgi:hypothetical protein